MNSSLEKLVDVALTDGYITDTEKKVLYKKAEREGFDLDELEMILNGRLHEINKEALKDIPKVNKCPNCGEVMTGISKVCKSCGYLTNSKIKKDDKSLNDSIKELSSCVKHLKKLKNPGSGIISSQVFKSIFTGGLYIFYKTLLKKEPLFDRYSADQGVYIIEINNSAEIIKAKYGAVEEVNSIVDGYISEKNSLIAHRRRQDYVSAFMYFLFYGSIAFFIVYMIVKPKAPETIDEKAERLVKEKKIGEARAAVLLMKDKDDKSELLTTLEDLEIDSLTTAGNYTEALRQANLIKDTGYKSRRENKIDDVIEAEVRMLVKEKKFKLARERVELAAYYSQSRLSSLIDVEEKISK